MTIIENIDLLRGRYLRQLKHCREEKIAVQIGLHRNTLSAFRRGAWVHTGSLAKIEAWCQEQEMAHGYR